MPMIADQYTEPLVELWSQFRDEVLPDMLPDPFSAEGWSEMKGPSETLDDLWSRAQSEKLGARGENILARVRDWLRGAELSALEDRAQVVALFDRCAKRGEWAGWQELPPPQREQILDQLLRTVSGLAGTILDQEPETKSAVEFTIIWQKDGKGLAYWESDPPSPPFSMATATLDVADMHGHFNPAFAKAVTKQVLHDLRTGDLTLPLLARTERSTKEQTWLRPISPGSDADKGLFLPERVPTVEDEIALRQAAPRVWRVYDEASVLAGREKIEPIPNWDEIEVAAAAEMVDDPGHVIELCEEIEKTTAISKEAACTIVGTPLKIITERSGNPTLKEQAQHSLAALRGLLTR